MIPVLAALALVSGALSVDTVAQHDSTNRLVGTGCIVADALPAMRGEDSRCEPISAMRDTVTRRRRAVAYSDAYATRLRIHRYASYTMLPLFATQYVLGNRLLTQKEEVFAGRRTVPVDAGLRSTHRAVAMGVAALFVVNTTTGVWNLVESRENPAGRRVRRAHAIAMLAADAGFIAVGILGARGTDGAPADARRHRNIALGSMALSTGGAALMWFSGR